MATKNKKMSQYEAVGIVEGFVECESEEQYLEAAQYLVDTGLAWSLQGFFGQTCAALIEQGMIHAKEA